MASDKSSIQRRRRGRGRGSRRGRRRSTWKREREEALYVEMRSEIKWEKSQQVNGQRQTEIQKDEGTERQTYVDRQHFSDIGLQLKSIELAHCCSQDVHGNFRYIAGKNGIFQFRCQFLSNFVLPELLQTLNMRRFEPSKGTEYAKFYCQRFDKQIHWMDWMDRPTCRD